jgi:hypothetical protein
VFPVGCVLDFYVPEDGILQSYRPEKIKSYKMVTGQICPV